MSEFSDLIDAGMREIQGECGVKLRWNNKLINAVQGSGVSYDMLVNGGEVDSENPTFQVLKTDVESVAPGRMFEQGDEIEVMQGAVVLKIVTVKSISFDPADPCIRISTEGPEQ